MRQRAKAILKHPLVYGSSIVVIGNFAANFFNFLFNVFMTRNLTNADYGVLASIISVISFPGLIIASTIPLVISFAGKYFAQGRLDLVRGFYIQIMKFFFIVGLVIFFGFLIFTPAISSFLRIQEDSLLIITSFTIFIGIISMINIAFIQAKLAFLSQVMVNMVSSLAKFVLGVLAVWFGFSVSGAVGAIFLAALLAYIASFIPLRFLFKKTNKVEAVSTKELFKYGIPSMLTWIGLTSLISVDILLVKHFFEPSDAGIYAAMALIAKVIFYIVSPISSVMFPLVVQKFNNKENFTNTFKLSMLIVCLPSALLTIFYFLLPEPTILFFTKKSENLVVTSLLGPFGIFMSFYTLLFIIANFYLSIKKTKVFIPILLGAVLQILLIYAYHDSFIEIITISTTITACIVFGLLGHYFIKIRKIY